MSVLRAVVFVVLMSAALAYAAVIALAFLTEAGPDGGADAGGLVTLGLPWTLLAEVIPPALRPALMAVAPLVDLAALVALAVLVARGGRRAKSVDQVARPGSARSGRLLYIAALAASVAATGLLAWWLVDPAPPREIRFATGPEGGFYEKLGSRYAFLLGRFGVDVELVSTAGTGENLRLLEEEDVSVALVQGGVAPPASDETPLRALASLEIEPLWLFAREPWTMTDLVERPDIRIAGGADGSGTQALLRRVLAVMGTLDEVDLVPLAGEKAANALMEGRVDVAAFVTAPTTAVVSRLLNEENVFAVRADATDALLRRLPFAHAVDIPARTIDFRGNVPHDDVHLIGAATSLVVRAELHPAVKQLILQVTSRITRGDRLIGTYGEFPSKELNEFPLDPEAERYFTYGPTLVRRYLPYWAANLLERFWVIIIPVATLLLPIVRFGPSTYQWGIRRRIYRHYKNLKELEAAAEAARTNEEREKALAALGRIDAQLKDINVPLPYRDDLYRLRMHAAFVRDRLTAAAARESASA